MSQNTSVKVSDVDLNRLIELLIVALTLINTLASRINAGKMDRLHEQGKRAEEARQNEAENGAKGPI